MIREGLVRWKREETHRDCAQESPSSIPPPSLSIALFQPVSLPLLLRPRLGEPRKVFAVPRVPVRVRVGRVVVPEREVDEVGLEGRQEGVHHAFLPVEVERLKRLLAADSVPAEEQE